MKKAPTPKKETPKKTTTEVRAPRFTTTAKESQPTQLTLEAKDLMRPDFDNPLDRRE